MPFLVTITASFSTIRANVSDIFEFFNENVQSNGIKSGAE